MALADYAAITVIGDETDPKQITLSGQSLALAESLIALMRDKWLWDSWDEQIVDDLDKCLAELQVATTEGSAAVIGTIVFWSTDYTLPPELLVCDGSEFDPDEYPDLFTVLSAYFTPNLINRYIRMSSTVNTMSIGGSMTHQLTTSEMPAHSHPTNEYMRTHAGPNPGVMPGTNYTNTVEGSGTNQTGGGNAHNNEPAYVTLAPCIVAL